MNLRHVVVAPQAYEKIAEITTYLRDELKFSEFAALRYESRFTSVIAGLAVPADYALCRFPRWKRLGYRCVAVDHQWIIAYQVLPEGIIVREIENAANLC